ncbi:MAG: hybrid sensor histidine kinase/response regulator [Thermoflexales bacterium]|nr:hybrid sensor histidine kinase/response regulator [Thermoflexales bacterium]
MSLSAKIREQLLSSFRAELAERVQTMTDGLLTLEQRKITGEQRQELLRDVFRAAHSLKGAARAVGVSAVEQLAHALEDVLGAMQKDAIELEPELFNACYRALDTIQLVQSVYESGGTTPPAQALKALADLDPFRSQAARDAREAAKAVGEKTLASPPPAPVVGGEARTDHQPAVTWPAEERLPVTSQPVATPSASPEDRAVTRPQVPALADETIRVSVSKLDALMAQLSELLVTKIHAEQRLAQVREAQELMAAWQKEWLAVRSTYSRLARYARDMNAVASVDMQGKLVEKQDQLVRNKAGDGHSVPRKLSRTAERAKQARHNQELLQLLNYVDVSQEKLRDMATRMNSLMREYAGDTMQMALVIDGLEEEVKRVRMLPLATITGTFGRMVRDLAQSAGKEAVLEVEGGEVELDKRVLEEIKDPLIHLLRNALDHGLEAPAKRVAAGKARAGKLKLAAEQLGKEVIIRVSDDGAGLDVEAIRRVAVRRGVLDAQTLTESELVELIFASGFSTSPIITDVSGRGVGLDVVRRNVESLQGQLSIDWVAGKSTTFTLRLPLALTSSRGLMIRVSGQQFAIPLTVIQRIEYVRPVDIVSLGGYDTLRYDGRALTLMLLSDVLGLPRTKRVIDEAFTFPVVIIGADRPMAFAVDELAGEQEIVIKGLGRQLSHVGGIAGASILGNGEVLLILSALELAKLVQKMADSGRPRSVMDWQPVPEEQAALAKSELRAEHQKSRILVVDDSITTRTLEKNILEAAGYLVQLATDGQEALSAIAAGGLPDLVVSDVAMPRLDGFGLTERLKSDARTAGVPVILVTSLDSPEDKARGIEVGADAYIIKSSFDQHNLLDTIEQLI